jgi:hypothetical protein
MLKWLIESALVPLVRPVAELVLALAVVRLRRVLDRKLPPVAELPPPSPEPSAS